MKENNKRKTKGKSGLKKKKLGTGEEERRGNE